MKSYGAFDILGPVMIGPSSSHTAGAARLGKIAATIAGKNITSVDFILYGSFAKTYKGHGTDKALVAGVLKLDPWDYRLRNSFEIAKESGLEFSFTAGESEDVHPNTVEFVINKKSGKINRIIGSSIGGGNIIITEINGMKVEFTGEYTTLIINHMDVPGMISSVSTIISRHGINIAFLKVFRGAKGEEASMMFEVDNAIPQCVIDEIKEVAHIKSVRVIDPVREGES